MIDYTTSQYSYADSVNSSLNPADWNPYFGYMTEIDGIKSDPTGNYVKINVRGLPLKLSIPDKEMSWFEAKKDDPSLSFYRDLIETDKDLQRFKTRLSYYINYFNDYLVDDSYGPIPPEELVEGMKETIKRHVQDYKNADELIHQITEFWDTISIIRHQRERRQRQQQQYRQQQRQKQQLQRQSMPYLRYYQN